MITKTEYDLCKEIHYRDGEILELRYDNSKRSREIERLEAMFAEKDELVGRCVCRIGEHLQENAKQSREIERLNARIHKILEVTPDVCRDDLFEYLKGLLVDLSRKEGNDPIDPDYINVKYIEGACRYCFPVLFDRCALLGDDDLHKIELADSILDEFGIKKMDVYGDLIANGEIDVKCIDRRDAKVVRSSVKGSRDAQDGTISES